MKDRVAKILNNCWLVPEEERKTEANKALRSISMDDIQNVADFCKDTHRTHYLDLIYYGLIAGYVIGRRSMKK